MRFLFRLLAWSVLTLSKEITFDHESLRRLFLPWLMSDTSLGVTITADPDRLTG